MQPLNLSKPLIIIMVGLPGAGKSFFARQFSQTFGAPVVSYDRIRFELFNDITFSKEEQVIVGRIADYQTEELLKTRRTFLVDGGDNTYSERSKLEKIAKKSGYEVLVVWVQVDNASAKRRSMKRSKNKLDDKYNRSLTADEYTSQAKRLTPPKKNEQCTVISGKHTYHTQAKVVLKKLVTPSEAQEKKPQDNMIRSHSSRDAQRRQITRRRVDIR